jgi:ribosome recycling factor
MNKQGRNSTRRFYNKLEDIKKQFRDFGYNIRTERNEVMQETDHSKQKQMDKLEDAVDKLSSVTDSYLNELKSLAKEV